MRWLNLLLLALLLAAPAKADGPAELRVAAQALADELIAACPRAAPDDEAAFAACRERLRTAPRVRATLVGLLLWGGDQPGVALDKLSLTRFDATLYARLYLPLFMFAGPAEIEIAPEGDKAVLRLPAGFRDRLRPGQFPYPFWHSPAKWEAYDQAHRLVFHLVRIDGETIRASAVLRSPQGSDPGLVTTPPMPPRPFDGKWTWTDAEGHAQPMVTLFDGYFRHDNPALPELDRTYRDFALELRAQDCLGCHVPSNPNKMRQLVLLQSPAHAAAEVRRVLAQVRDNKMPLEDWGDPKPLADGEARQRFLARAQAFAAALDAAEAWDRQHP